MVTTACNEERLLSRRVNQCGSCRREGHQYRRWNPYAHGLAVFRGTHFQIFNLDRRSNYHLTQKIHLSMIGHHEPWGIEDVQTSKKHFNIYEIFMYVLYSAARNCKDVDTSDVFGCILSICSGPLLSSSLI